jgi:hypothetical protein
MRLTPAVAAVLAFTGLSVMCGIGVHLVAELAALGWRADAGLIFSAHHIPLGILALLAFVALALGASPAAAKAFSGRGGARLFVLALLVEFVVFATTEAGEGLPIQSGDVGLAMIAAVVASALGALLIARYEARVIEVLAELFVIVPVAARPAAAASWQRIDAHVRVWRARALVFAASRRPPPSSLVIRPFVADNESQEIGRDLIFSGAPPRHAGRCIEHRARARRPVRC